MTKRNFTDEEVIKALECCANGECDECPYQDDSPCKEYLNNAALDLINRQRAEIESLNEIVFTDRTEAIKMLKAEAIKEFAKRLKNSFGYGWVLGSAAKTHIDNLVKEMTEGKPCTEGADCFAAEGKE